MTNSFQIPYVFVSRVEDREPIYGTAPTHEDVFDLCRRKIYTYIKEYLDDNLILPLNYSFYCDSLCMSKEPIECNYFSEGIWKSVDIEYMFNHECKNSEFEFDDTISEVSS